MELSADERHGLAAVHRALTSRLAPQGRAGEEAGGTGASRRAAFRLSLLLALIGGTGSLLLSRVGGLLLTTEAVLGTLAGSLLLYRGWVRLPEALERKRWLDAAPAIPRLVALLAMGLRTRGSLDHAVALVAKRGPAPFAGEFAQLRWEVQMGACGTLERSLAERAVRWGAQHPELKAALQAILIASHDRSLEGIRRSLDRAEAIALTGSRRRLEEFSASLMGPTTALFALGVLLPLVLGALLPLTLISTGLKTTGGAPFGTLGVAGDFAPTVVLLNLVFPLAALLYAWLILLHRPAGGSRESTGPVRLPRLMLIATAGVILAGLPIGALALDGLSRSAAVLGMIVLPFATLGLLIGRTQHLELRARSALHEELPDALFRLGSRLASGEPLLAALRGYLSSHPDKPFGRLIGRVLGEVAFGQCDLRGALSAASNLAGGGMTPGVAAALETIGELAERDETAAGALLLELGQGLGELQRVERESALRLAQVTQMMGWTAALFAPLTLGLTVGLYSSLVGAFADLPGPGTGLSVAALLLVLGLYLVELGFVIHYFLSGLRGASPWARLDLLGSRLLCGLLVFLSSALASLNWLGG